MPTLAEAVQEKFIKEVNVNSTAGPAAGSHATRKAPAVLCGVADSRSNRGKGHGFHGFSVFVSSGPLASVVAARTRL